MKRYCVLAIGAAILASSCTNGAGAGAYAGSSLGSVLGSAIGGIAGGPHGSDIGTIVGMASGAIVGGAIGDAADRQQRQDQQEVLARRNQRIQREKAARNSQPTNSDDIYSQRRQYADDYTQGEDNNYRQQDISPQDMVDSTNSGDDRIDFGTADAPSAQGTATPRAGISASQLAATDADRLEIRNVRFADDSGDGKLQAGEEGRLSFEIYNHSQHTALAIVPTVEEADANKYIYISPSILVESIAPGQGIRYTAAVKADRRIKDGTARLMVSAMKDGTPVSYTTVVKVDTMKRR